MVRLIALTTILVLISMSAALYGSFISEYDEAYNLNSDYNSSTYNLLSNVSRTYGDAGDNIDQGEGAVNPDADLASSILTSSLQSAKQLFKLPALFASIIGEGSIIVSDLTGINPIIFTAMGVLVLVGVVIAIMALIFKIRP